MVYRQASERKTVRRIIILSLTGIFSVTFSLVLLLLLSPIEHEETSDVAGSSETIEAENITEETEDTPNIVDFQPIVDEWVAETSGNKSVIIFDIEQNTVVGEYNTAEDYNTASLYKLFVVYEGYRRLQSGEWDKDDAAGSTGYTMLECLDLSIRESYSPCAETLWSMIGHEELDEIIEQDFGIYNSDISGLTSNAEDILTMMLLFYRHPDFTDEELVARMKDSFLNQPETTYDWRQGLPSGFSVANVYNKVGWSYNSNRMSWDIYHDAAIVEFVEDNRHFAVIVMTNNVDFAEIRELGVTIEQYYNSL